MKVVVCVKHIPHGHLRIDPDSKRLERMGGGELNKVDLNAIEEALRLKEAADAEVVVVSMAPERGVDSLRTALALGADRAVLITDPAAVGSDLVATAKVLARVLDREHADLVLFGQQASDSSGGALWAAVAEQLRCPVVSQAIVLSVNNLTARVTRQTEFGDEIIEAPLPIIVSVSDAMNKPRYASLKGMMGAKRKPLEVLSLEALGVEASDAGDAGAWTTVLEIEDPPPRAGSTKIEGEGHAAQVIVDLLVEKQLL